MSGLTPAVDAKADVAQADLKEACQDLWNSVLLDDFLTSPLDELLEEEIDSHR
jgi:hypothetical protein